MTDAELKELVASLIAGLTASLAESGKETDRRLQETDRLIRELQEGHKKTELQMQETDRRMQETDRQMKETDRKLEKLGINIGGISNSNGEFAEEYFFNSLEKRKKFAGIHFNEVSRAFGRMMTMPNGKKLEDEFDIVMVNKKSVAIIEVKYKAKDKYIEELATVKVKNFKTLFPDYKDFNIYLGLGSLSFDTKTVKKAKECGVGLLKQVGEVIEYKANWDLKAY